MKMGWGNKSDEHYVALTWKGDNSAASLIALVERHGKNPELVITAMMSVAPRHVLITLGLEKGRKYKRPMLVRKWEQKLVEMKFIKGWEKTECTGDKDVLKRTKNNWKALVAYVPLDEVLDVHYKDGNAPVTEGPYAASRRTSASSTRRSGTPSAARQGAERRWWRPRPTSGMASKCSSGLRKCSSRTRRRTGQDSRAATRTRRRSRARCTRCSSRWRSRIK